MKYLFGLIGVTASTPLPPEVKVTVCPILKVPPVTLLTYAKFDPTYVTVAVTPEPLFAVSPTLIVPVIPEPLISSFVLGATVTVYVAVGVLTTSIC